MIGQIIFIVVIAITAFFFIKRIREILRNIKLGRPFDASDHPDKRWRNLLLVALGQKKMFKKPIPAILHLFVYLGFIIINIEVLEIILDGITGSHRMFATALGFAYGGFISIFEVLAVLVILGCAIFLIRRNMLNIRRFNARELTLWPKTDANIILITEIALMAAFLTMDAADIVLQQKMNPAYPQTGSFLVSGTIAPFFSDLSEQQLILIERTGWWFHIVGILGFLIYIPYSKHLHIFLSFPNVYFSNIKPKGKMENMPVIANEVKMMFNPEAASGDAPPPPEQFAAKDVDSLSRKNILDAYSCTECGRCTAACPANITGKLLSPRKIMMDTRDRAEEVGKNIAKHGKDHKDNKALLGDYILTEELRACTSCMACVEECPVNINPLAIIHELRRHLVMDKADAPPEWNMMFTNIENNQAPWQFSPTDRFNWANDIETKEKAST